MTRMGTFLLAVLSTLFLVIPAGKAFAPPAPTKLTTTKTTTSFLAKKKEDLSYIESRDMTKEEMLELNKRTEETMNKELAYMTGFSLVLSLPILYLCWVAFFSE